MRLEGKVALISGGARGMGPSEDPLLDLLVHDTQVARLTRQRMEELQQSAANDN